jgi:hypothetical protein
MTSALQHGRGALNDCNEIRIAGQTEPPVARNLLVMPRYLFQIGERRGDIERLEEDLPHDNEAILGARFFVADLIGDAACAGAGQTKSTCG